MSHIESVNQIGMYCKNADQPFRSFSQRDEWFIENSPRKKENFFPFLSDFPDYKFEIFPYEFMTFRRVI